MEKLKNAEIRAEREKFKDEIAAYEKLTLQIENVNDLKLDTTTSKSSLAFLIEETKKKNPSEWQNDVEKLIKEIDEAEKTEGKVGVVWLIASKIDSAYIEFLTKRIADVKDDESLKEKLRLIKQMTEKNSEFRRNIYEKGQVGGFGGVSFDYIPQWYYLTK